MSLTESSPRQIAEAASLSSNNLGRLPTEDRSEALTAIHQNLLRNREKILAANARDLETASQAAADGKLSQSILKRLDLGRKGKYEEMLKGILDVRNLEDIVGKTTLKTKLDEGLILERVTCPIGVLLIIFEARPEVIANIAALAIKSGNAAILKGGKESSESFIEISKSISEALSNTKVPNGSIQLVRTRDVIEKLLELDKYIDLVIPRGSNDLVRYIKNNTRIPVLGHADGICSTYVHADADPTMVRNVIIDAKLGYPAACNAVETLLVDEAALQSTLPQVATALLEHGTTLRCDSSAKAALSQSLSPSQAVLLQDASEEDFDTEFLSPILAIKTVPAGSSPTDSVDFAIAHINAHSSKHTDAILTTSSEIARRFQAGVDSACVFWNTSTRMNDGLRFGFGTEVGISTNKVHSRGPVGLEGLLIYKYLVNGNGQIPSDYHEGEGGKAWKHERIV